MHWSATRQLRRGGSAANSHDSRRAVPSTISLSSDAPAWEKRGGHILARAIPDTGPVNCARRGVERMTRRTVICLMRNRGSLTGSPTSIDRFYRASTCTSHPAGPQRGSLGHLVGGVAPELAASRTMQPLTPSSPLFDYLIRAWQHQRRDREAKRLGRLEVDDQL